MKLLLVINFGIFAVMAVAYGLGAFGILPPSPFDRANSDAVVCGVAFAAAVGFFIAWRETHRVTAR